MRPVNLLFDEEYEDVDIISVPDEIADSINDIAQQFFSWLGNPENARRFYVKLPNGKESLGIDTKEFVWWLNHVFLPAGQAAGIVTQHTSHHPEYPTANF